MAYYGSNPYWGVDGQQPGWAQSYATGNMYHNGAYTYHQGTQTTGRPYNVQYSNSGRYPGPYPEIEYEFPCAQLRNSTGGTGCEPGYSYFFPPEHTKILVLRTGSSPPWRGFPPNFTIPFKAFHVPCNITVKELMKGFGCNDPLPRNNNVYEVVPGGNGKWIKGIQINGLDEETKWTIKKVGWDQSRNGQPRGKPVVYLYFETAS